MHSRWRLLHPSLLMERNSGRDRLLHRFVFTEILPLPFSLSCKSKEKWIWNGRFMHIYIYVYISLAHSLFLDGGEMIAFSFVCVCFLFTFSLFLLLLLGLKGFCFASSRCETQNSTRGSNSWSCTTVRCARSYFWRTGSRSIANDISRKFSFEASSSRSGVDSNSASVFGSMPETRYHDTHSIRMSEKCSLRAISVLVYRFVFIPNPHLWSFSCLFIAVFFFLEWREVGLFSSSTGSIFM